MSPTQSPARYKPWIPASPGHCAGRQRSVPGIGENVARFSTTTTPRCSFAPPFRAIEAIVRPLWPACRAFAWVVRRAIPFPYSPSLVATFFLGIGAGSLSNLWWRAEPEVRRAVGDYGGDLRIFLHDRAKEGSPVSLTMKNRKVYVGLILVPPGLEEPCYLTLLPTLSGYRDAQRITLVFTTAYEHVYEDLERRSGSEQGSIAHSFGIVLPVANIESVNRYDNDIYARYFGSPPVSQPPPVPAAERANQ